jgi:hypothetical protein
MAIKNHQLTFIENRLTNIARGKNSRQVNARSNERANGSPFSNPPATIQPRLPCHQTI